MSSVFHSGELAVQERAGVRHRAAKIGTGIRGEISPAVTDFLHARRFVIAAGLAPSGAVWAAVLAGEIGFLETIDEQRLRVRARPVAEDPFAETLRDGSDVGLVAIDLAHRRRVRVNGRVELRADGFELVIREVFGNCPKYIQVRAGEDAPAKPTTPTARGSTELEESQRAWIRGADTFFIGTRNPEAGADASHRGGEPGFVEVIDVSHLAWGDYSGNRMFQTLGNLASDAHAGLVFIDFDGGRTLQLSGRATIDWDEKRSAHYAGAERVVDFAIERVVETRGRDELRRTLVERSPYNPR
jgi:predicted pyridoxine 5'-phosphate oxidase superfamily flavin-nucleotide-binding protein